MRRLFPVLIFQSIYHPSLLVSLSIYNVSQSLLSLLEVSESDIFSAIVLGS